MSAKGDVIEFSLFSEGSNKSPRWGIKFRHAPDVSRLVDTDPAHRPSSIEIEFADGRSYSFGIRDCFWNHCREFVDADVAEGLRPVRSWAVLGRGYTVSNKRRCQIEGLVVQRNVRLKLVVFR